MKQMRPARVTTDQQLVWATKYNLLWSRNCKAPTALRAFAIGTQGHNLAVGDSLRMCADLSGSWPLRLSAIAIAIIIGPAIAVAICDCICDCKAFSDACHA
eukprot:4078903-Lingulodinium_polyedra.AAC.1